MYIVKYTDTDGFAWAVLVKEGTPEEEYEQGAFLGPPNMVSLGLSEAKLKKLHEKLVDNKLYNAPLLMGNRAILKKILTEIDSALDVRVLLNLFQLDYYGA